MTHVEIVGIDMHIGSQIAELAPYREAVLKLLSLVDALARAGIVLKHVDCGGGLGIRYRDETPPSIADHAKLLRELFEGRREAIVVEPGRARCRSRHLLTRVLYLKAGDGRHFAIVDAAMNDLVRPALYKRMHHVEPVHSRAMPLRGIRSWGRCARAATSSRMTAISPWRKVISWRFTQPARTDSP
jgi:diaminopimelate decarboxylase